MKFIAKQLIKIAKQLISERKYIDKTTAFFKSLIKYKVVQGKQIYKDNKKRFYTFDEMHGHWQVFNERGKHIAVKDQFGNNIEKGIEGRKIDLK